MTPTNLPVVNQGYWESYKNSILSEECSIQSLAAKASCVVFPIFLILASVFALIDNFFTAPGEQRARQVEIDPVPALLAPLNPIKVNLEKARQYDISDTKGNMPAACTFHAFEAMRQIGAEFNDFVDRIAANNGSRLSKDQTAIINQGLFNYEKARSTTPDLIQGADLENMRAYLPDSIQMGPSKNGVFTPGVQNEGLAEIAAHLFGMDPEVVKVVWMKNPNDESFALIGKKDRVIVFDSHYNEIQMVFTKEQIAEVIQKKLGFDPDLNLFDYALGRIG